MNLKGTTMINMYKMSKNGSIVNTMLSMMDQVPTSKWIACYGTYYVTKKAVCMRNAPVRRHERRILQKPQLYKKAKHQLSGGTS